MKPDVSIIIPNRNGEKTIEKTITAAENSLKGKKFEILVIDDCSEDSSASILKRVSAAKSRIKIFQNQKRIGAAASRNKGIKNSLGNVLLFLDNDVFLKGKSGILLAEKALAQDSIIFPKIIFENNRIMWPALKEEESFLGVSACFALSRKALERAGLFDENYESYMEDADFFLRCRISGIGFYYEKKAVALHAIPEFYNAERRYFLENRNLIYGMLKFRHLKAHERKPFTSVSLLKNLVCGIFNFRWFDYSHYPRRKNKKLRLKMLLKKHKKITEKSGILLVGIFFYAIFYAVFYTAINSSRYLFQPGFQKNGKLIGKLIRGR